MKIKPEPYYIICYIILIILQIGVFVALVVKPDVISSSTVAIVTGPTLLFLVASPVLLHSLTFDKNGCTVEFFKYKRTYQWEDFSIIRLEGKGNKSWMFFSIKPVNKSRSFDPFIYCVHRHPFSCFFVTLVDSDFNSSEALICPYDKEEFLSKMEEWGVSVLS